MINIFKIEGIDRRGKFVDLMFMVFEKLVKCVSIFFSPSSFACLLFNIFKVTRVSESCHELVQNVKFFRAFKGKPKFTRALTKTLNPECRSVTQKQQGLQA